MILFKKDDDHEKGALPTDFSIRLVKRAAAAQT